MQKSIYLDKHTFNFELNFLKKNEFGVLAFRYDRGDSSIRFSFSIPFILGFYFSYIGKFAPQWEKNLPYKDWSRELSLRYFNWTLYFNLWTNPDGYQRSWRRFSLDFLDILFGQTKCKKYLREGPYEDTFAMPERKYDITVSVWEYVYTRRRLPFWSRAIRRIDLDCAEGIPFPGKGENSWDLGDDFSYSMSCPSASPENAKIIWRKSILRDRLKNGGENWSPQ